MKTEAIKKKVLLTELLFKLPEVAKDLPKILRALSINYTVTGDTKISVSQIYNTTAKKFPDRPVLIDRNNQWSYTTFNNWVNRLAHQFQEMGFQKGDVASILLENRSEMMAITMALAKLGCISALLNTSQRHSILKHSIELVKPKILLIGEELLEHYLEIKEELNVLPDNIFIIDHPDYSIPHPFRIFDVESTRFDNKEPEIPYHIFGKDPYLYVYTSGTSGLPKASIFSHGRFVKALSAFGLTALRLNEQDRLYVPLPFYHATAMVVCWSCVLAGGAALIMKKKFSVSEFWPDIRRYQATAFGYVGELCKYLLSAPPHPDEKNNTLKKMVGNGLRPGIWNAFKERFGIEQIAEFYASSEGNIAFFNTFNLDQTMGFTVTSYAIVEYDKEREQPVRDNKGYLKKVPAGGVGLLLGEITRFYPYDGYTDKSKTESTMLRNVFSKGDAWFNTGDLVRDMGFKHTQFVDRTGDTFRWKGENVSTTELEEIINQFEGVGESIVYGVEIPDNSGRAGMVNLILNIPVEEFNLRAFHQYLSQELPSYAIPLFIRFSKETETTTTFKYLKSKLKEEGYDCTKINTPVYALLNGIYVRVTPEVMNDINSGKYKM
jgi:citronellyl-CoA synthetase